MYNIFLIKLFIFEGVSVVRKRDNNYGKELLKHIIYCMNQETDNGIISDKCIDNMLYVLDNGSNENINNNLMMFKFKYGLFPDDTSVKTFDEVALRFNTSYEEVKKADIEELHLLNDIYNNSVKHGYNPKVLLRRK